MMRSSRVDKVIYLVRASHADEHLDRILNRNKDKAGRTSSLTSEIFLIGMLLSAIDGYGMVLTDVYDILTRQLPFAHQVALGIRDRLTAPPNFSQDGIDRRIKAIRKAVEYGNDSAPGLDDAKRQRRRHDLMAMFDAMLDVTLLRTLSGYASIDSSGLWAFGRNPGKKGVDAIREEIDKLRAAGQRDDAEILTGHLERMVKAETDKKAAKKSTAKSAKAPTTDASTPGSTPVGAAAQAVKDAAAAGMRVLGVGHDPDARSSGKTAKDGKTEWYYGYELHILTRVADPSQEYASEPNLVERFDVTPGGRDVIAASQGLLRRAQPMDTQRYVIGDRLYSNLREENWYLVLTDLGWKQVVDMREKDQAWTLVDGMRQTAGWCHCPATPDHFECVPRPSMGVTDEFMGKIAERRAWAAYAKEKTPLRRRYVCPALAAQLRCPLRPETLVGGADLPLVGNPPDASTAPDICNQGSVVVHAENPTARARLWQDQYWGSDKQVAQFNRRTSVEQVFSKRKCRHGTDMSRGFVRVTGLAMFTLAVGFIMVAGNILDLEAWVEGGHDDGRDPDNPLLQVSDDDIVLHMNITEAEEYDNYLRYREQIQAHLKTLHNEEAA